jgi:dipeptidyl aminopeptidase/acylaminoacyl peptidase
VCGNHDSTRSMAGWSDRYRGPRPDGEAWAAQANASVAHKLEGNLLLITGDLDENVHPAQTLVLVDALIRANRRFELLVVPNAGHDVLTTNTYALTRMWDFFIEHLLGEMPPEGFVARYSAEELECYARRVACELRE